MLPAFSTIGVDVSGSSWSVIPDAASINIVPLASYVHVVDGRPVRTH